MNAAGQALATPGAAGSCGFRCRADKVRADWAYGHRRCRTYLSRRGISQIRLRSGPSRRGTQDSRFRLRTCVRYAALVGTWHDPDLGRPLAASLERCAELLGVDLAAIWEAAAKVEPYLRADGAEVWSLMQLERQLRPEAYGRRRGGYLDRRRIQSADP
jgi:hypothetical protein